MSGKGKQPSKPTKSDTVPDCSGSFQGPLIGLLVTVAAMCGLVIAITQFGINIPHVSPIVRQFGIIPPIEPETSSSQTEHQTEETLQSESLQDIRKSDITDPGNPPESEPDLSDKLNNEDIQYESEAEKKAFGEDSHDHAINNDEGQIFDNVNAIQNESVYEVDNELVTEVDDIEEKVDTVGKEDDEQSSVEKVDGDINEENSEAITEELHDSSIDVEPEITLNLEEDDELSNKSDGMNSNAAEVPDTNDFSVKSSGSIGDESDAVNIDSEEIKRKIVADKSDIQQPEDSEDSNVDDQQSFDTEEHNAQVEQSIQSEQKIVDHRSVEIIKEGGTEPVENIAESHDEALENIRKDNDEQVEENNIEPVHKIEEAMIKPVGIIEEGNNIPSETIEEGSNEAVENVDKAGEIIEEDNNEPVEKIDKHSNELVGDIAEVSHEQVEKNEYDTNEPVFNIEEGYNEPVETIEGSNEPVDNVEVSNELVENIDKSNEVVENIEKVSEEEVEIIGEDSNESIGNISEASDDPVGNIEESNNEPVETSEGINEPVENVEFSNELVDSNVAIENIDKVREEVEIIEEESKKPVEKIEKVGNEPVGEIEETSNETFETIEGTVQSIPDYLSDEEKLHWSQLKASFDILDTSALEAKKQFDELNGLLGGKSYICMYGSALAVEKISIDNPREERNAIQAFRALVNFGKKLPMELIKPSLEIVVRLLVKSGRERMAVSTLEKFLPLLPEDQHLKRLLVNTHIHNDDPVSALKCTEDLDQDSADNKVLIAKAYKLKWQRNDDTLALKFAIDSLTSIKEKDSEVVVMLGELLQRSGDEEQAIETYAEGVERGVLPSMLQRPSYFTPSLTAQPVWGGRQTPELSEEDKKDIVSNIVDKGLFGEMEGSIVKEGVWGSYSLAVNGQWLREECRVVKKLCEKLEKAGYKEAYVSVFYPSTLTWTHTSPDNTHLHILLPVSGAVSLRLAEFNLTLKDDTAVIDPSFEKEFSNSGDIPAVMLVVFIAHPDLSL